jgi:PRC-barrel domain
MTRLPSRLLTATLALVATSSTPTLAQDPPAKASVSRMNVGSVLGIEVRTSTERNVGRIIDLLAAPNGGVEAVVVEFGGFLGIGTRKIALEWSALRLDKDGGSLVAMIEIPREQLRSAPDYKPDQPIVVRRMEATLPATAEPPYETEPPQPSKEKPISRRKQR